MRSKLDPDWTRIGGISVPSTDFDATLAFFEGFMGFPIEEREPPPHDTRFRRRTRLRTPNGLGLEVIEPAASETRLTHHPVISIAVPDPARLRREFEAEGIEFLGPFVPHASGGSRTEFREPGGAIFELWSDPNAEPPDGRTPGTDGIEWILLPSTRFDATVAFLENTMRLPLEQRGVPVTDLSFHRYAQFRTGNGVVLEVVEPTLERLEIFGGPVASITVRDLPAQQTRLEDQQIEILADIVHGGGFGWFYFRVPGSTNFQFQGAYRP